MKQITLSEIDNGWLVGTAPEQPTQQNPQGKAPFVTYCANYDEVCVAIKQFFSLAISK